MTHLFLSFASDFSTSIISPAVCSSKFPVGSSAKIIGASETNARAIATLCCCPPDNFKTLRFTWLSSKPNCNKISFVAVGLTKRIFSKGVK